ncbi:hypothetical protein QE152_g32610 [Popillia japonica]|uniref:Uncharacterized protein n=1 Tax=Popillia japonica TaxID=7064 RepID=A0AAW1IYG9_POPJA
MKPHCIWRLEYQLTGLALLPKEGDELKEYFKILEKHHPQNAPILNTQRSINAVIYYGVICKCNLPNFEVSVQRPVQQSLDTLQKTMTNMKMKESM